MRLFRILLFLYIICVSTLHAQSGYTTFVAPSIRTLRLAVDGDAQRLPVISLTGGERLTVSFDDMGHEYRRFTYTIQHVDHLGQTSDRLFDTDFVDATAEEEVVENYRPSVNTTVLYTHYEFSLPNANLRPLLSGNYRLTIAAETETGDMEKAVVTHFAVVDQKVGIAASCSTNTDTDWNEAHQQLSLSLNMGALPLRDVAQEVKVVVVQNRRFAEATLLPHPTAQNGSTLIWDHCRALIFKAGNEFRKMEMLSTRYPGMHGESMKWYDPYFHYTLFADAPRSNYLYDEDRDGLFVVRSAASSDPDSEADYAMVHFTLLADEALAGQDVYVAGGWAVPAFDPRYRLHYNASTHAYEATVLLKQGYYNYQYLAVDRTDAPKHGLTAPFEGDFFQTENEYAILVYYKPTGERYDQLIGVATPIYRHK